ncbi:MAG TPA: hypothetical protein PLV64_08690 [Anaerolineales bacterium]|jgi:hypothetical protein|nr:hypothetical protein [Anaerolineales bacterium]
MLEQPTKEIELTVEQRRNLGHVYRLILGWRRERKNKEASQPASESSPEERQPLQSTPESAEQTESES